jgi:hypothetical protein
VAARGGSRGASRRGPVGAAKGPVEVAKVSAGAAA